MQVPMQVVRETVNRNLTDLFARRVGVSDPFQGLGYPAARCILARADLERVPARTTCRMGDLCHTKHLTVPFRISFMGFLDGKASWERPPD